MNALPSFPANIFARTLPWIAWALFITFCVGLAISCGLRHADDAWFATISKSLVWGDGYATPFAAHSNVTEPLKFNPHTGVGPTLVVPGALAVAVFGNHELVPGLCAIFVWGSVLTVFFLLVRRSLDVHAFAITCLLMLLFWLGGFARYFVAWHAFIGEATALSFLLLGHWVVCASRLERKNLIIAGLLFGLAVQTKLIALYGLPGALLLLAMRSRSVDGKRFPLMANLIAFAVGAASPHLVFEIYKLACLGGTGFVENWSQYLKAVRQMGTGQTIDMQVLKERLELLSRTYAAWTWLPLFFAAFMLRRSRPSSTRLGDNVAMALLISGLCSILYWLLMSAGWARYAWIGVGLLYASLAFLLGSVSWRSALGPVVLVIMVLPLAGLLKPYLMQHGLFRPDSEREARRKTSNYLIGLKETQPVVLVSRWWGSFADIEYLLPETMNFVRIESVPVDERRKILLINKNYMDLAEPINEEVLKRSAKVLLSEGPYELRELQ